MTHFTSNAEEGIEKLDETRPKVPKVRYIKNEEGVTGKNGKKLGYKYYFLGSIVSI